MKRYIKLAFGVMFAAMAVMAATQSIPSGNDAGVGGLEKPCYSDREVKLLMNSNHWSEQEVKTILDLACQFSHRSDKTTQSGKK